MKSGIYRFINNRTGEVYVGQSHNVFTRRAIHHKELSSGTHHNKGLQEDHDRGDTFTFEILEKMPEASREELEKREIYYIEKFNSFYEGYNLTPGGEYDKYKGYYEHGGDRLPFNKYEPVKLLTACPNCGGELVKRKGEFGNFVGCSNYPKCTFSCSLKRVDLTSTTSICKSCGKRLPEEYSSICPFCGGSLDEDTSDENLILELSSSNFTSTDSGITFKQFCSKKRNYLNRYDCSFLSDEYDIDISNADTVKKSNAILKDYLNENDLWDTAMEDLFIDNIRLNNVIYKQEIGELVLGYCPNCGKSLKRESKFFITCETYPDCDFSCIEDYYLDHILKLNSELESSSIKISASETKFKRKSEFYDEKASKHDSYGENAINQEELHENEELKKSEHIHDKKSEKTKLNYCSNCGSKLESKNMYCWNCGEKIDKASIDLQNNTIKKDLPQNKNEINSSKRNWGDIFGTLFVIIIIIAFIFSLIIMLAEVDGPISTVATGIVISIVCFFCYVNAERN